MDERAYNLAIETSGRTGTISLGHGDELLAGAALAQRRRHNIELMPTVARLCAGHGVGPGQLGEVYVALGPGSFTGLRVALAMVKMLAFSRQVKVVGVASVEVLAQNTPSGFAHAAVCLNLKRGTVHSAMFGRDGAGMMRQAGEAGLRTWGQLLAETMRPMAVLGDPLPREAGELAEAGVTVLGPKAAVGRSEVVWRLGRERAKRGAFDDAAGLWPLYIRQPEAVELWERREMGGQE